MARGKRLKGDLSLGGKRSGLTAREDPGAGPHSTDPQLASGMEESGTDYTSAPVSLGAGLAILKAALVDLPDGPGVYRMHDKKGTALYVGKARHLQRRVTTYTQVQRLPRRLQRMVAETAALEVVTARTEVEALLLESNLIKRLRPRYNVLLRDDKSFPYIVVRADHDFPQIEKHRGARALPGDYFGPFASAGAVNRTLTALEKAFLLRSCSDASFAQRSRPCLMYQIKRCAAPCVGYIDKVGYGELVAQAQAFLTGRSPDLHKGLQKAMAEAAEAMDFEKAAIYRDRIKALAHIQAHHSINLGPGESADLFAIAERGGQSCIQVFFVRSGRNYGNRAYFPSHDKALDQSQVLSEFLALFYEGREAPANLLVNLIPREAALLALALGEQAGRKVQIQVPQRGARAQLMSQVVENAETALARRLSESGTQRALLEALAERFGLEAVPERIEVYDNSHMMGEATYGGMIVVGPEGFAKGQYRKFKTKGELVGGDDYGMMREVLTRRFARALKEDPDRESGAWPDLVLLDGGKGQLSAGQEVLAELGIEDVALAAIAKGPERDAGREQIFIPGQRPFRLPERDPLLYFLQRIRDEAHRFAISSHRSGRAKTRLTSALDQVPGIGAKRKRALLSHFGAPRAVQNASVEELTGVEGISQDLAQRIHDHFRGS